MQVIHHSEVKLHPNRQRKEDATKHIEELRLSIERDGLLHAPVLDGDGFLVSGFCRLSAIARTSQPYYYAGTEILPGYLPVHRTHQTDPLSLHRIELEENIRRKNLSFMEEAAAVAELHRLQSLNNPDWNKTQTAEILASALDKPQATPAEISKVTDSILLDKFKDDPDVAKAPTKQRAVKIAKAKTEALFREALGELVQVNSDQHEVVQADILDYLSNSPSGLFDGILADPPYGMGADTFGDQSFHGTHKYEDSAGYADAIYQALANHGYRVCKDEALLFTFLDIKRWWEVCGIFQSAGWVVWPIPLIWFKGSTGHAPQPGRFPKRTYEAILMARKGERPLNETFMDVLSFQHEGDKVHAAQKPTGLYSKLLSACFLPGDLLLDPCAGSGPLLRAAKTTAIRTVNVEMTSEYIAVLKELANV